MQSDEEIIKLIKEGNKDIFDLLIKKYKTGLYSYIFYSVKDESTAEDIFQETLLKVFTELKNYKESGKFKPWLYTIARNKITDYFRASSKTAPLLESDDDVLIPSKENVEKSVSSKISFEYILKCLDNLAPQEKEIIILRQYLSFKEIAETLNCPLGTALARLNRAIKKLQNILGDSYGL